MKKGFAFVLLLLCTSSVLPVKAQEQEEKGKFALGLFGEYGKYEHSIPLALQADYLKKNLVGSVVFSFNPYSDNYSAQYREISSKTTYTRISVNGGLRLGRKKAFEIGTGYTLRIENFTVTDYSPYGYRLNAKGQMFSHFIGLNVGYRFNIGKHIFIKPELLLNYRFGKNVSYSNYEVEYFSGYTPITNTIGPINFQPQVRLGIGFTFGK